MKFIKAFIIGLAAVLLLEFILTACAKEPPPPLRVGINIWPGSESLYLARDLGYYANSAIKLIDYPSNSELLRAYRNGDIEVADITLDEVLLLAETTPDLRLVLIQDFSSGADAIVGKRGIKNLQALKGRTVGVEITTLGTFVLSRALGKVGMSIQDVKTVSLPVEEDELAFKQKNIDAVVTYEPTLSKLQATGGNLLFDSRQIPGEIMDGLVMHKSVVTNQTATAKNLISGWFRALDYAQKYPQDAARRMALHEGVTPEQFLKSLTAIHLPDVQENKKILGKIDAISLASVRKIAQFMQKNKLLKQETDPIYFFDTRLIQDIEPSTYKHN